MIVITFAHVKTRWLTFNALIKKDIYFGYQYNSDASTLF